MGNIQKSERSPSRMTPFRNTIVANEENIRALLPRDVSYDEFQRVALNAALHNSNLAKADNRTLFLSLSACAQDGLLPNGREAALVPFFNSKKQIYEVVYMPMIQGVIKRVLASGDVAGIGSNLVHDGDDFEFYHENGEDKIRHRPQIERKAGARLRKIGVYAFAKLQSGAIFYEYMTEADIALVRKSSKSEKDEYGAWVQHEGQMWRKTVLHRLARRLPLSSSSRSVIERVEQHYDFDERPMVQTVSSIPSKEESLRALEAPEDAPIKENDYIDVEEEY